MTNHCYLTSVVNISPISTYTTFNHIPIKINPIPIPITSCPFHGILDKSETQGLKAGVTKLKLLVLARVQCNVCTYHKYWTNERYKIMTRIP